MPSQHDLDDLNAKEDAAIKATAAAEAAAQAGDAVLASRLYEDAGVAWAMVAHGCYVYAEEEPTAGKADLTCWAARCWLARVDALTHAADLVRSTSPDTAKRIDGMIDYCLDHAAWIFEACGQLRLDLGDADGARGPLARALSCLLLLRRRLMERDLLDPEVMEMFFHLERLWRKLQQARKAPRAGKKKKAKKKRARRRKHA